MLRVHALLCFCTYLQKVRSKKTNKKQFKILEKDKYATPDQIFEAFVGITNDLTPPICARSKTQTYKCKCCTIILVPCYLLFVAIIQKSTDLNSKLLYWFLYNSNTGLKIVKLNSPKNAMTHMLFLCYEPYCLIEFAKMSIGAIQVQY